MSAITIASVALGFGITAAFFISYSSFIGTSVNNVNRNTWDAAVDFVAPLWDEDVARIVKSGGIASFTPYTKGVAQLVLGGTRTNLYVGGFDPGNSWQYMHLVSGQGLSNSDPSGVVLEESTVRQLGLSVGSKIVVEEQGRQRLATVRGVFSGAMPGEARFTIAFYRDLADLGQRSTGILVRSSGDLSALSLNLQRNQDVQQVLTKAQVSSEILAASDQVTEIIRLGALISISIAALFVFACVGYSVLQRSGEYQTLRVLGYRDSLITLLIVVEIGFLGAASLLVATPVGALVAEYLNRKLSQAWFQVDTIISLADYLKTFIPGFLLLPLVALPVSRLVLRVPVNNGVRSGEIS
jgi:ABC-type lipoprotein release transport system permease subunit